MIVSKIGGHVDPIQGCDYDEPHKQICPLSVKLPICYTHYPALSCLYTRVLKMHVDPPQFWRRRHASSPPRPTQVVFILPGDMYTLDLDFWAQELPPVTIAFKLSNGWELRVVVCFSVLRTLYHWSCMFFIWL